MLTEHTLYSECSLTLINNNNRMSPRTQDLSLDGNNCFRRLLQLAGHSLPPDKKRGRLILLCLLSAVELLSHNTGMLQTPPHSMPSLSYSVSLCKPVNSSTTTIIKAFWLITPFNWTVPAARAKWRLVSSAAEQSKRTNKQANK